MRDFSKIQDKVEKLSLSYLYFGSFSLEYEPIMGINISNHL